MTPAHLYILYIFFAFTIAGHLTLRSNSNFKFVTFILSLWILAGSVLNSPYFIADFPFLPFDLQPSRLILIIFSIYYLATSALESRTNKIERKKIARPKFEIFLYIYILSSTLIGVFHTFQILSLKDLIVDSTHIFTFLIIFIMLKRYADEGMIRTFCKSLIIVCIISSLISVYQFLINPTFFRLGSEREAFGGLLRANGIFHAEYIQSYFLISGILTTLFTVRSKLLKYTYIGFFLFGIIFTFHRMSWLMTIFLFVMYLIVIKKIKFLPVILSGGGLIILILMISPKIIPVVDVIRSSHLVEKRLLTDTITFRFKIYKMVMDNISKRWVIGCGTRKSDIYYQGMMKVTADKEWAKAEVGGIHNGYLHIMFLKGVPAVIIFLMFLIFGIFYFGQLISVKHIFYFIPLFEVSKFMLANMTNVFLLSGDLGLLLAIFIGVGVAVNKNNLDINKVIYNNRKRDYENASSYVNQN